MAKARRGFCAAESPVAAGASLDGFIGFMSAFLLRGAIGFEDFFFVEDRLGNDIFFRGPGAEIEEAATLRTEGEILMLCRVSWLLADGAAVFHIKGRVLPHTAWLSTERSTNLSSARAEPRRWKCE